MHFRPQFHSPRIGLRLINDGIIDYNREQPALTVDPHAAELSHMARTRVTPLRPKIQAPAASEITHTRFLVSAERLFCVNGYEGTKIRAIATLSNANLGMLSHYWGSKRALFREVFDRRLRPIHEERMRRFRVIEKNARAGKPFSLAEVLQAQIEPSFILPGQSAAEANARRLLLGRALTDPSEEVVTVMGEIFAESGSLFFSLLRKSSPDTNHSEFYWRANCVVGAFTFAESYTDRLTQFIDEDLSDIDWLEASSYVVRFLAAGMRAPAVSTVLKRKKARARAA